MPNPDHYHCRLIRSWSHLRFTPEEPKLLGRAAQMIINHGLYTKEALLNELTFDANNLERL